MSVKKTAKPEENDNAKEVIIIPASMTQKILNVVMNDENIVFAIESFAAGKDINLNNYVLQAHFAFTEKTE